MCYIGHCEVKFLGVWGRDKHYSNKFKNMIVKKKLHIEVTNTLYEVFEIINETNKHDKLKT